MKATQAEIKRIMKMPSIDRLKYLLSFFLTDGVYDRLMEKCRELESDTTVNNELLDAVESDLSMLEAIQRLPDATEQISLI